MQEKETKLKIIDISAVSDGKKHSGTTRVCAPAYTLAQGETVAQLPADIFVGPCRVVNVNEFITGASIDEMFLHGCERVIFKGGGKAGLMTAAAEELAELGVRLVGIDSEFIASAGERESVYTALFAAGCCVLEGLDLSEVDRQGDYFLIAPPVKMSEQAAAPARALLVDKYLYWNKPELFGL